MPIAFKIKKSAYDNLSDDMKELYIAGDADGEFVLDVQGAPQGEDTGPLKRALTTEREKNKTLQQQLNEANGKIEAFPDVDQMKKDHKAATGKLSTFVEKSLKDNVALGLATKISSAPALLTPHIAGRLAVDLTGDEPKTVVLGKDGKPDPEMTIEKLQQEFVANPDFKAIIIASKASGGMPTNPTIKPPGSRDATQDGEQGFDASKAKPADLAARIKERKATAAQSTE
jgi:hypothetical protein